MESALLSLLARLEQALQTAEAENQALREQLVVASVPPVQSEEVPS